MKRARDSEEQIIAVLPEGLKACSNDLDVSGHALTETLSLSADYRNALIINGWSLEDYPACVGLYKSGYRLVDGAIAQG